MAVVELGRRERKKLAVRESICEETLSLVSRHGIEGTTIDAICDCADIAKKTFYNYYSSKHELLIDICQSRLLARLENTVTEALASGRDLGAQLDFIFTELAERNRNAGLLERELVDYMVGNLSVNPSQGAGQLTLMNDCYQRLFEIQRQQLQPHLTPAFCAEMTVGMSNAITLNWLHREDYDAETRFRQLADYLKKSMIRAN
ncbi:MAG: helix-turn-helix domain containing protein [Gammaproteobacteria bacterium]|nr:helix-turn-helix domain containing protein [Gammaproteobacteria bacterium]